MTLRNVKSTLHECLIKQFVLLNFLDLHLEIGFMHKDERRNFKQLIFYITRTNDIIRFS